MALLAIIEKAATTLTRKSDTGHRTLPAESVPYTGERATRVYREMPHEPGISHG